MKQLILWVYFLSLTFFAAGAWAAEQSPPSFLLDYSASNSVVQSGLIPEFSYMEDGDYAVPSYRRKTFPLQLWRIDEDHAHKPRLIHDTGEQVIAAKLCYTAKAVVTAADSVLTYWNITNDKLEKIMTTAKSANRITQIAASTDGTAALLEDSSGNIVIYKHFQVLATLEQKTTFFGGILSDSRSQDRKPQSRVFAFHPQGDAFVKGDDAGFITTYLSSCSAQIKEHQKLQAVDNAIADLVFAADDVLIVLADDGRIESWKWSNGALSDVKVIRQGTTGTLSAIAQPRLGLSRDRQKLISKDKDGTVILWWLKDNKWTIGRWLTSTQKTGYQDAFFSHNVPMRWRADREYATAITGFFGPDYQH
ncbi:MAG TPA: hypothetical protein VEL47_04425 [Myxococcota bacterium]|nr:hypothetical protein [Myxococcota bacterium]